MNEWAERAKLAVDIIKVLGTVATVAATLWGFLKGYTRWSDNHEKKERLKRLHISTAQSRGKIEASSERHIALDRLSEGHEFFTVLFVFACLSSILIILMIFTQSALLQLALAACLGLLIVLARYILLHAHKPYSLRYYFIFWLYATLLVYLPTGIPPLLL